MYFEIKCLMFPLLLTSVCSLLCSMRAEDNYCPPGSGAALPGASRSKCLKGPLSWCLLIALAKWLGEVVNVKLFFFFFLVPLQFVLTQSVFLPFRKIILRKK